MTLFEQIKTNIQEDKKDGLDVDFRIDEDGSILVWDGEDENCIDGKEYRIVDPDKIDADWAREKIIVSPSLEDLQCKLADTDAIAEWLANSVDPAMLMTLENIVFIGDTEEDFDFLREYSDDFAEELECNDLPDEGQVGLMWYVENKIFVNVGEILETTKEMKRKGDIEPWEASDCFNEGIGKTLLHEVRHLAQANPYLPEDVLCQKGNDEVDAESYADKVWQEYGTYLGMVTAEPEMAMEI